MCACQERFVGQARMSTVDGFPYKEEVGGSNPSVPTNNWGAGDSRPRMQLKLFCRD